MSLYDIEKFEPPPDPDLVCCICQCVLDKAVESPCRHVFCQVCIERWLTNRHTCPTCRKRTKKQDLKPVLPLVQNMLNRLIMKCDYRDNGCLEKIMLEQFEKHVQSCEYEMKTCRFSKCGAKILKMYLTDHERNSCEHRESICEGECGLMIPLSDKGTHNCVAALKAHIEEKNRMIETLKTKLQELNNLSQSLNDQLEQLRQQLDERPRLLSLTSFSGSESDVTDFMSETLSDESLFDEASQHSTQQLDNNAAPETGNNPENTNTASDVVEQVERTIVTTLFDVSSRLEVVRNQMRAVLDAGFVNHDDNLNLATPALNAIVNNNSTVGTSVNANTSTSGNYQGNNTNDLNSNRLMQTLNSLISGATDNTENSMEAQDGDVNPNWTSININEANTTGTLRDTGNNSFSEFENGDSNHGASSDYYQYSSDDNDRHTENSSRPSSNNQSFSDHYSRDGRYLQEHVIVSEPPGSPSNSNSSFSSSSSSIPTLSSVQGSPGHSSFNASTPNHDSVFPDSWTDDNCAHSNESLLRLNESPSFLHTDSTPPSFLRNNSPNMFMRDRYPVSPPSFLCRTPSFLRDKSDSSSRSSHSHESTDPAIRSEENSNSDTDSNKSQASLSEASQNSPSEHLNFSDSSNSDNITVASSGHQSDSSSSGEDLDKSERSRHESGQETCTKQGDNDTAADNKQPKAQVHSANPVSGYNSDHETGDVTEPTGEPTEKDDTDTSLNTTGNRSRRGERKSVISLLSSSTDESHHNSTHITVSSDSSDDSDKSESIKYLTKRLKRVQKEEDKVVDCKTEKFEEKSENENQSCATSVTDKTVNKDDNDIPLTTGRSDNSVKIRVSRKRRACTDQLYQGSHCKKSNVGSSSYGSASNVLGLQGAVPSHTISSTEQGPTVRRTRSSAIQASTTGQDNNAQSLNVKIDLSLINYSGQLGKHSVSGPTPSATVTANLSSMNKSAGTKHENSNISDRSSAAQVHKNSSPRTTGIPQNTHRQAKYTRHMDNRSRSQARVDSPYPARSTPAHTYNTRAFQHSWCDDLDMSDSSDDSYVPGSDCNDTDITISEEEYESDTSYEVEIPKTTADLLDEYGSNDSDESWTVGMN